MQGIEPGHLQISLQRMIINLVKIVNSTELPLNLILPGSIQVTIQVHRPIAAILKILRLKQSTLLRLERMSRIQNHVKAEELQPRYKTWTKFQNSGTTEKTELRLPYEKHERLSKP